MVIRGAAVVGAGLLTSVVVLSGCSSTPDQDRAARAEASAPFCRSYTQSSRGARTPVDAMRTESVLVPFVDLIELSTRQAAQQASSAPDPVVAGAMREVVAAVDDLDAQGSARLPAGADLSQTAVKLDPARLSAALDGADRACARLAGPATSRN